jgi:hypothetical protein
LSTSSTSSCCSEECRQKAVYAISVVGAFLIMVAMVAIMRHYTRPEATDKARADERAKNLAELNNANSPIMKGYDWQDKPKGFVRLPIERAMDLVVKEWENPSKARAQMAERVDKLTAAPPKPPEKKSEFE